MKGFDTINVEPKENLPIGKPSGADRGLALAYTTHFQNFHYVDLLHS